MLKIGQTNTLQIIKQTEFGVFVDGGEHYGNVLLPKRYVPENASIGQDIRVFIYFDSEDNLIATTEKPFAEVGQFAKLKCVNTNRVGAFMQWGLPKDLLVPFSEQRMQFEEGHYYLVFLYIDNASGRIVATTKYNKHIDKLPARYRAGEKVHITVLEKTELGYKCAINDRHSGLIFHADRFGSLSIGKNLNAYIKEIRPDGKINLSLQQLGKGKIDDVSARILKMLAKKEGFLPVGDKSSPEQIFELFKTSKATFKKSIGHLYKEKRIRIESHGISLIK